MPAKNPKTKTTNKKTAFKKKRSIFRSPIPYIVIAIIAIFGSIYVIGGHAAGGLIKDSQGCPVDPAQRPTIRQGNVNGCVWRLQKDLVSHGSQYCYANIAVDGAFGPATRNAVTYFQATLHLGVDGIVGPQTWQYLSIFCE